MGLWKENTKESLVKELERQRGKFYTGEKEMTFQ